MLEFEEYRKDHDNEDELRKMIKDYAMTATKAIEVNVTTVVAQIITLLQINPDTMDEKIKDGIADIYAKRVPVELNDELGRLKAFLVILDKNQQGL